MGFVSGSTDHQAEILQLSGLLYEDIIQIISSRTDACTSQIKALFEDAGVSVVDIQNELHGDAPIDIRQDAAMKQLLEADYHRTLKTMKNLTRTTASESQTAFISVCDRAYMQVSSGAFSYQEAVRMAVRELGTQGAYVRYPTGHRDRIDVAARRCVLTGVSQAAGEISRKNAEYLNTDFMELSAHSGARPEHARWQGQLVDLSGKRTGEIIDGLRVLSVSDIGYGTGRGFKGWNCRHDWYPYIVGISTPNYTQEQLKKLDEPCIDYNGKMYTEYEISQIQRYRERKVRKLKRETMALQTAYDNAEDAGLKTKLHGDYSAKALRLKKAERELADFCKATKQDRDRFREQVYGFGRSEAQRAVHGAKVQNIRNEIKSKYGSIAERALTVEEQRDIIKNKEKLSNADVRKWYLECDKRIPDMINTDLSIEAQARQAFELRNSFRTIARDMMQDVKARAELDISDPNRTFEELVHSKMSRKGLSREEAIKDILVTATKTRASVNKKFGLE